MRAEKSCKRWPAARVLLVLTTCCLLLPGCQGCGDDNSSDPQAAAKKKQAEEEKKKKEKEKPKPDFEPTTARVEPFVPDRLSESVKPGHWTTIQHALKANNYDFLGEMTAELSTNDGGRATPLGLEDVPFYVVDSRPAVLPKGQQRFLDIELLVPASTRRPRVTTELRQRGGMAIMSQLTLLQWMPSYQYYFFVLSRESSRYKQICDALEALPERGSPLAGFGGEGIGTGQPLFKFVVPPLDKDKPVALPQSAMSWTSIAYVLWDDVDPGKLSLDQQRAMIDWLHWGGQLILSGPETLTALQGSFLDTYLPVSVGKARQLSADDLKSLGGWNPKLDPPRAVRPWAGAELKLKPGAAEVASTGGLVAEMAVGRGRVIATGFNLHGRELFNWPGYESFFNACLLRLPPRVFVESDSFDAKRGAFRWQNTSDHFSALLTTRLRYMSRDCGADGSFAESAPPAATKSEELELHLGVGSDDDPTPGGGVAGWNDKSAVSLAARDELGRAAGIDIPKSTFVAWSLAAYLIVLVPVNWLVFRLLGRVELAWAAVPLLAIAGALFVTKAANLNIGFARSQNEIDVLELQSNYPRGHVTRYAALYTSLSTTYDVRLDDPYGGVQPLAAGQKSRSSIAAGPAPLSVHRDADHLLLSGFAISSNSTAMLHAEQMFDAGGAISYAIETGRPTLRNRTSLTLHDARVLRLDQQGQLEQAIVGDLPPGEVGRRLEFQEVDTPPTPSDPGDENTNAGGADGNKSPDDRKPTEPGEVKLRLEPLIALVGGLHSLRQGDVRLIAKLDKPLPGMDVQPAASASRSAVLVVAHLAYASPPPPQPDSNLRRQPLASTAVEPSEPPTSEAAPPPPTP